MRWALPLLWESQFTLSQDTRQDTRNQRKTSIKAALVHNLKRRSSELLCGLFVWKVDDGDGQCQDELLGLAWLGLGLGWLGHTETHIIGNCPRKKEVNCRLLSENESVCRKTTRRETLSTELNRFSGPLKTAKN